MLVQKIPKFHCGYILKREMMVEMSAYLYQFAPLLYQNCMDGIVSGCMLTATENSLVVNSRSSVMKETFIWSVSSGLSSMPSPTSHRC